QEIYKVQCKIEVAMQMGVPSGSSIFVFLRGLKLNREDIFNAVHRLENGSSRVKEEVFWVHAGPQKDCLPPDGVALPDLIEYLKKRRRKGGKKARLPNIIWPSSTMH